MAVMNPDVNKGTSNAVPLFHPNMTPDMIHWTLVEAARVPPGEGADFLSNAEQQKFAGMRFPKRRGEWLLGRWAAKSLLQSLPAYREYALNQIEITNTPEGSPQILLPDGRISRDCLSIGHREGLAFCALATTAGLRPGADLEKIEARPRNFSEDYFTAAEQALVNSQPANARDAITTLIWSAKEAMLKSLGVGLRWDTRRVEILRIENPAPEPGKWSRLQVDTHTETHHWSAWWQRRADMILTLAGHASTPVDWLIAEVGT